RFIDEAHHLAYALLERARMTPDLADRLQSVFLRTADYESQARLGDPHALTEAWAKAGIVAALHLQLGRVVTDQDRRHLLAAHRVWGQGFERIQRPPLARRTPTGGRKIRIGILSS